MTKFSHEFRMKIIKEIESGKSVKGTANEYCPDRPSFWSPDRESGNITKDERQR